MAQDPQSVHKDVVFSSCWADGVSGVGEDRQKQMHVHMVKLCIGPQNPESARAYRPITAWHRM